LKTQSQVKVMTLAKHKEHSHVTTQSSEQLNQNLKYILVASTEQGKVYKQVVMIGFGFTSDWMTK